MIKRISLFIILTSIFFGTVAGQPLFHSFGVGVNAALPTDQLSSTHNIGYEITGEVNLNIFNPSVLLHIGGGYIYFGGKKVLVEDPDDQSISEFKFPNYDFFTTIVGIKMINERGFFVKPTIHGAFDTNYQRVGAGLGFGYGFKLFEKVHGEVRGKLSLVNILGNKKEEITSKTINFGIGLIF